MSHDHSGHSHNHDDHGQTHAHAPASFGTAFAIGIALNLGFVVIEALYGLMSNSVSDTISATCSALALLAGQRSESILNDFQGLRHRFRVAGSPKWP